MYFMICLTETRYLYHWFIRFWLFCSGRGWYLYALDTYRLNTLGWINLRHNIMQRGNLPKVWSFAEATNLSAMMSSTGTQTQNIIMDMNFYIILPIINFSFYFLYFDLQFSRMHASLCILHRSPLFNKNCANSTTISLQRWPLLALLMWRRR